MLFMLLLHLFQLSWLLFQLTLKQPKVLKAEEICLLFFLFHIFQISLFFPINILPNNNAPKAPKNRRNLLTCLFISCFIVSLTPAINTSEFSSNFIILIISSNCSFEMTKMIPFPTLTTSLACVFLWTATSFAKADVIGANGARILLAKGQQLSSMYQQICLTMHQEIDLIEWF